MTGLKKDIVLFVVVGGYDDFGRYMWLVGSKFLLNLTWAYSRKQGFGFEDPGSPYGDSAVWGTYLHIK